MSIPQQPLTVPYNDDGDTKNRHSQSMRQIYRQAQKLLPGFKFKVHFNPGGPAVMGETYAKIYAVCEASHITFIGPSPEMLRMRGNSFFVAPGAHCGARHVYPVVEAYDTSMGLLVRQWDGRNSGRNHYVNTVEQFVELVHWMAAQPFVRF
jgi:hypothetical protein